GQLIYEGSPEDVGTHLRNMGRTVPKGENNIEYLLDVIQDYDRSAFTVTALVEYYRTKIKPPPVTTGIDISGSSRSRGVGAGLGVDQGSPKMLLKSPSFQQMQGEASISMEMSASARVINPYDHSVRTPKGGKDRGRSGIVETLTNFTPSRHPMSAGYINSMDVISTGVSTPRSSDYTVRESGYFYKTPPPPAAAAYLGPKFPNSFMKEVLILMKRNFKNIQRTPELFVSRQVVLTVMGFMMATMFLRPKADVQGMTNVISFFISTVCLFFFSSNDAVPAFIQERFIFIRETSHNAYRASSYVISGLITYLPFLQLVQAVTYFLIVWFALNLHGD
ncbi:hypothetical protein KI387_012067, partial [Taxus chinensis]